MTAIKLPVKATRVFGGPIWTVRDPSNNPIMSGYCCEAAAKEIAEAINQHDEFVQTMHELNEANAALSAEIAKLTFEFPIASLQIARKP